MPLGPHVLKLIEEALAECFSYHKELDTFILRVGLAKERLAAARSRAEARKGRWPAAPKRFVAQELLDEISTGTPDDDRLAASLVTALCRTAFPGATAAGLAAVEALKAEREEDGKAAAQKREEWKREQERLQRERDDAGAAQAAKREAFRQKFLVLCQEQDTQKRGYALEKFLNDFMAFEGLSPRGAFKLVGEQIDGSFTWSGSTFLVEAKWVAAPVDGSSFGAFDWKISGKTANTRGLFVSMNGFSPPAILALNAKGALRFVCIDGAHLMRSFEYGWNLPKVLRIVWRHADETGEAYLPVSSQHFIDRSD